MGTDREQAVAANRARLMALAAPPPPVSADAADELLRSTVCPKCGYDLNGLPAVGACPECGRPYGGAEVCLYGFAAGAKASHWNRRPPTRWQLAFTWAWSLPLLGLFLWARPLWRTMIGPLAQWTLFIAIGLIVNTWRALRGQAAPPDTVQVRFTPAGVSQLGRGLGPIPYERVDRAKPVPWRKIDRMLIQPKKDGLVRLTLGNDPDWWKLRVDHVDAVVRCPPEALAALRARIAEWRAAADRR